MADNTTLNTGSGGDVIATDDIAGVKYQRVKITLGADGVNDGDVASANALPVDGSGVTQPVSAASLPLPSGAATEATLLAIQGAQLPDGHNVTVDNASIAITAASLPLPTGAATEATLSSIDTAVNGTLKVDNDNLMPGSVNTFGHQIVGQLNNQVDVQFFRDTPANLVTVTTANGGTATQNVGGALFASSTNANGEAKGESTTTTIYRSGAEVYCLVACSFTAGIANSYQRIGLYDANNGFFIGYEGTSFGVTVRNNASDTTVAKASFSEDDLTGGAGSLFTRDGSPEAIDLTKLNVFRIRFGWLGSAPVSWEVLSPDGRWVTFHKTKFPNLQAVPSIRDADLPVTLHINKTAAAATDLQMQTDCWGAGVTTDRQRLDDVITDAALATLQRSVLAAYNGTSYANIQATAGGNLKISVQEISDGLDVGAGNAGAETQRVILATDQPSVTVDDGAGSLTVDAASWPLPTGAATAANQLPDGHNVTVDNAAGASAVNIQDGGNSITVDGSVSLAAAIPAGTNNIGDVDIASALPAGTNAIGDVGLEPRTSGGTSIMRSIDLDETEEAVKATAGQVYWIMAFNLATSVRYLKFYNATVATVVVGTTTPVLTIPIPTQAATANGSGFVLAIPHGIEFDTAITVAATTGVADADTGAPGANEVIVNIGYA